MSTPTTYRRSDSLSALIARHQATPPPVMNGGQLQAAPGNPTAPRADARPRPLARPAGTRTAAGGGHMTRAEALAIVRRMMRQAAAPPRMSIRVLVPLGAAPSLLERLHKVTQPDPAAGARALLERLERVTAPRPRPAA